MRDEEEPLRIADLLKPLAGRGRQIRLGTLFVVAVTAFVAMVAYFMQPMRRVATVEFRPVFEGVNEGRYPNGSSFSPNDVIDPSVLEQVYANNGIDAYCSAHQFQSAFSVRLTSPTLRFIDLDYQARLSEARLTAVERRQLQSEYESRRAAADRQYELQFVRWRDCIRIPDTIAFKAVSDTLEAWARDATERRGVTRARVAMLSPHLITDAVSVKESLFVRADMLRRAMRRVIQNVREVEALPGAELVRGSARNVSFREIRAELELVLTRLEPLLLQAGSLSAGDARGWVERALETATIQHNAAQKRVEAYRAALRDYSGMSSTPVPAPDLQRNPADGQALSAQIDRSFIDRIIEMSEVNTTFRQGVTENLIKVAVQAVEQQSAMEEYTQLKASLGTGGAGSPESVETALQGLGTEAADVVKRFNEIYDEFNRVTLRAGSALYQIEGAPYDSTIRTLALSTVVAMLIAVLVLTPVLLAVLLIASFHLRRLFPARVASVKA